MNMPKKPQKSSLLAYFWLAVAVIIAYKVITEFGAIMGWLGTFIAILRPFLIGFCIAYILNIPQKTFFRLFSVRKNKYLRRFARPLSLLATYLLLFLVIFVALYMAIPAISKSIVLFLNNIDTYRLNLEVFIADLTERFDISVNLNSLVNFVSLENILSVLTLENLQTSINTILGVSSSILNGALALVSSVYFLLEAEKFRDFALRFLGLFVPERPLRITMKYLKNINRYFKAFIRCQIIDATILGSLATIGLWIIGSQYFLILGPMLGIANVIPYFGSIIGSIVAVIIIAFTDGIGTALIAGIFLLVLQQTDGNLIQPKLLGGSLSLSPLLIIIGITVGGAFWGVLGMLVAVPIVTILKNVVEDIINQREHLRQSETEPVEEDVPKPKPKKESL